MAARALLLLLLITFVSALTKQDEVKKAFQFGWRNYMSFALGHDDLRPVSQSYADWLHLGATIVDSIDTIIIMDLKEEYQQAQNWIAQNLTFDFDGKISVFETTIRIVGGLCSAHSLTNDTLYLNKAKELALKLLPAFNTPTGIPLMDINLHTGHADSDRLNGLSSLAAIGSLQMEFVYLAKQLNDTQFSDKVCFLLSFIQVLKVIKTIADINLPDGLPSILINPQNAQFQGRSYSLGPRADSFYEYLIKMFVLTNENVPLFKDMFDRMMAAVKRRLVRYSSPSGYTYLGNENNGDFDAGFSELVCFAGGMFTLASTRESNFTRKAEYLELGTNLTISCDAMRIRTATGISPESVDFSDSQHDFSISNPSYLLRPETVESYFYLYRTTKNAIYQTWGWAAFQGILTYCHTPNGWSGINDVDSRTPLADNYQQSFFMAETLKYLYPLFSENNQIDLNEFVFNTEAHPLRIFRDDFSTWKNIMRVVL